MSDTKEMNEEPELDIRTLNFTFAGCGFLGIYYVGVLEGLSRYTPYLNRGRVAGASAGSLAACNLISKTPVHEMATTFIGVAEEARSYFIGVLDPRFDLNETLKRQLLRVLPMDVHLQCSGRLHVSVTRYSDFENVTLNHFDTRDDVIQALLASCFIPFCAKFPVPTFRDVGYVDGGFTNNMLILDENTITVSPFAGQSDICPQEDIFSILDIEISNLNVNLSPGNMYRLACALFPPSRKVLQRMCEQGFLDFIRFMLLNDLIFCPGCASEILRNNAVADGDCRECKTIRQRASRDTLAQDVPDITGMDEEKEDQKWIDKRFISLIMEIGSNSAKHFPSVWPEK